MNFSQKLADLSLDQSTKVPFLNRLQLNKVTFVTNDQGKISFGDELTSKKAQIKRLGWVSEDAIKQMQN